jgi:hypothetical protein
MHRREAFGQQVEVVPIPLEPQAVALTVQQDREPPAHGRKRLPRRVLGRCQEARWRHLIGR